MAEKVKVVAPVEEGDTEYTPWKVVKLILNGKTVEPDVRLAALFALKEGDGAAKTAADLYFPQAATIKDTLSGALTVKKDQTGEVRTYNFTGKQLKLRIATIIAVHDSKIKFHQDVAPKAKAEGGRQPKQKVVINFAAE